MTMSCILTVKLRTWSKGRWWWAQKSLQIEAERGGGDVQGQVDEGSDCNSVMTHGWQEGDNGVRS